MRHTRVQTTRALLLLCLGLVSARGRADEPTTRPQPYQPKPGPYTVAVATYDWRDAERDRDVPAKIYYPKTGDGLLPVIIFSHGLGGSRDGYEFLGRYWASHGYVCVHLQHHGSDNEVWKNQNKPLDAMRAAAADPQNGINRPLDVRFALDQMTRLNREEPPFKQRLDLKHVGVAGHSFGAYTALAVAGQSAAGRRNAASPLADPRVTAAIPMSAPVPKNRARLDEVYGPIRIPCLHMTATRDDSPIADTKAADRRLPFDHSNGADQFLITFKDGDHGIFTSRPRVLRGKQDARFHDLIRTSSLAFWDAYLRGEADAKAWLTQGSFKAELGKNGKFEQKLKRPASAPAAQP